MLNGRAHKDRGVGRKTFFSHRGESAIDYIMCSKAVVRNVVDFEIHEPNVFSDHVVVSCTISMCCESREEKQTYMKCHYLDLRPNLQMRIH